MAEAAANGMRVMLVDDHPVVQEIMRAVLARTLQPNEIHAEKDLAGALSHARACAGSFERCFLRNAYHQTIRGLRTFRRIKCV